MGRREIYAIERHFLSTLCLVHFSPCHDIKYLLRNIHRLVNDNESEYFPLNSYESRNPPINTLRQRRKKMM